MFQSILCWRKIVQRTVWPVVVVLLSPLLDPLLSLLDRLEPVDIQTLVAETGIKTFDKCIIYRLSGANEVETNAVLLGPSVGQT